MPRKIVLWKNKTTKRLKGHACQGNFMVYRGKRFFQLTDVKTGRLHEFDSPEAAKKLGWVRGA